MEAGMKNFKYVMAGILGLALLTGCSSPKHKPAELVKFEPAITVSQVWTKGMGESPGHLVPAVYDDNVWVAGGKQLDRLDARRGDVEWSETLSDEISGGVGSDGYVTAVGLRNGDLVVVNGSGSVAWTKKLTTELKDPPLVAGGLVIARTRDMRISAFEASTGDQQWVSQRNQPSLTVDVPTYMVARDNFIFVGQPNGYMAVMDITNGRQVFEFPVGQAKGITEVERLIDVVGSPAISYEMLCAASYQGAVSCINAQTGEPRWSKEVNAVASPAIDDDNVYVVDVEGKVYAYYRESGELRWTNEEMTYRGLSFPVAVPGAVAVGDKEGYIHFLSPRTGVIIGRIHLSGAIISQGQPFGDGAIFQTEKGEVAYIATR